MNNNFDILTYLNDIYMAKIAPELDIMHAGGYHNLHDTENNEKEEILEKNKKRIHIPNARIENFSYGQQENFEEYNEPETDTIGNKRSKSNRKRRNELSTEGIEEKRSGGVLEQEVIEI